MLVTLGVNTSEKEKINKSITATETFTGSLRDTSSITEPEILIESSDLSNFNYAIIPDFGRHYFIRDIISVRTNLWLVKMKCDVLMSFREHILGVPVILSHSKTTGADNYLSDSIWNSKVKELTDIVNFSNGFLNDGEFILITAGG